MEMSEAPWGLLVFAHKHAPPLRAKNQKQKGEIDVKKDVPIAEKYNLTIDEAAAYFNIGTDRLREITEENKSSLVLMVGSKKLIKKKKMEEYLDRTMVL